VGGLALIEANQSTMDKTGIPIENLPAKALVEVYINENDASEHSAIPSNTLLRTPLPEAATEWHYS
jgi:hypothetical protein